MEKIFQTIKYLPDKKAPDNLHKRIMRKVLILRLRPYIYAGSAFLILNFVLLSIEIYRQLLKSGALAMLGGIVRDFRIDSDFLGSMILALDQTLPHLESAVLFLNLFLIIYLSAVFKRYRHELL